jgi:hypothetical protein
VTAENIYNWDKKGFLIGIAQCVKRILTRELYNCGRITAVKQDGSQEFISLLATICTDRTRVPPALIYKSSSGDLQSSWIENLQKSQEAYFASSANRWSSNGFGITYINTVFDPATWAKAGRGRQLLIVDGHSSHINLEFLNTCDRLRILVLILSPHSTHKLQPCDVGCFLYLATYYSQKVTNILHKSAGLVSITKRMFWPCFKRV